MWQLLQMTLHKCSKGLFISKLVFNVCLLRTKVTGEEKVQDPGHKTQDWQCVRRRIGTNDANGNTDGSLIATNIPISNQKKKSF